MKPIHTEYVDAETLEFPGAITLKVLLSGKDTAGTHAVFEDIVAPGVGPGRHIHRDQDETFFFMEGEYDVEIGGVLHHMKPGDVGFVPRGTVHAFKNVGQSLGKLRYIFSPALVVEEMFRSFYDAQQKGALDLDRMSEIADAHGQSFVGPPL